MYVILNEKWCQKSLSFSSYPIAYTDGSSANNDFLDACKHLRENDYMTKLLLFIQHSQYSVSTVFTLHLWYYSTIEIVPVTLFGYISWSLFPHNWCFWCGLNFSHEMLLLHPWIQLLVHKTLNQLYLKEFL